MTDKPTDPRSLPITDLDLSPRARHAVDTVGATVLGDLEKISEATLRSIPGVGHTTTNEILFKCRAHGIELAKITPAYAQLKKPNLDAYDAFCRGYELGQRAGVALLWEFVATAGGRLSPSTKRELIDLIRDHS